MTTSQVSVSGKRKYTQQELEDKIATLEPYREALLCILRGEKPVKLTSGKRSVWLLGASRVGGGVILLDREGHFVQFAERWALGTQQASDPFFADLGEQVFRAIKDATIKRLWPGKKGET